MTDFRELCAELVNELEEWVGYTHEEDGVIADANSVIDRARKALSNEPDPEKPTQRQLMMLADDMGMASVSDAAEYARAVLARWGNYSSIKQTND